MARTTTPMAAMRAGVLIRPGHRQSYLLSPPVTGFYPAGTRYATTLAEAALACSGHCLRLGGRAHLALYPIALCSRSRAQLCPHLGSGPQYLVRILVDDHREDVRAVVFFRSFIRAAGQTARLPLPAMEQLPWYRRRICRVGVAQRFSA